MKMNWIEEPNWRRRLELAKQARQATEELEEPDPNGEAERWRKEASRLRKEVERWKETAEWWREKAERANRETEMERQGETMKCAQPMAEELEEPINAPEVSSPAQPAPHNP